MEHSIVNHAVYYLLAAVVAVPLFRKIGLGAILGYLAAGVILGPSVTGTINDPEDVLHFAEFGVVMLLFLIGLELAPDKLWQMRSQILLNGGTQLVASAALIALVLYAAGLSATLAVVIGLTLGLSSTAFAIQLMADQGVLATAAGRQGFAILLLQDIAVIPLLLFVESLAPAASASNATPLPWWLGPAAVVAVLVAGRYLANPILRIVAASGSREIMTGAGLLIVLGVALLMETVGLSMGLGAFVAGIVLANSSFRRQLETDIEPFKGILLGLFFIAVGMTLDLELLLREPLLILGAALGLMAVKTAVITAILRLQKTAWGDSLQTALMLCQGGEFAFVIMAQALAIGVADQATVDMIVLVVGVSMALTSPLVALLRLWGGTGQQQPQADYDSRSHEHEPEVIIAGFGRFGQIVGRMLVANRIPFTALDKDASHVDFIKRFGNRIFYGDATRSDLLHAAGIEHARLLVVAVDDVEESLQIVRQVKADCPEVKLIARAHNRMHAYQLYEEEVDIVVRETFESSLLAATQTLIQLGYNEGTALERADMFRLHDEGLIREAAEHRDDLNKLLAIAREGRRELEQLFGQDSAA
ncbi:potassium transporter [Exilibacterium tricleocarpae]|uniref:Potassium transporter n=1 Tax=Exilibacterium tricleocarpae TaxID=2591008 RepID=A0A545T3P9_9GAMM|nr:monovalent cation:proton antiporter-2 (CPA2) family protein [Exilibacterium tricleocarpae]TQV71818.1 potassium transporter [Exilibacterium tricleocarpae]